MRPVHKYITLVLALVLWYLILTAYLILFQGSH